MSARNRITVTPAHEQQIRAEWFSFVSTLVGYDLDGVGRAVASLESGRTIVHRHVPADGVGVSLGVIGGYESAHRQRPRLPSSSLNTLPVRNATLAGLSARRRIRYGYHCVPNGT